MDEEELELKLDELYREFHEDGHSTQLQSMEEELVLLRSFENHKRFPLINEDDEDATTVVS